MSSTGIVVAMRVEARCLTTQSLPFNQLFRLNNTSVTLWLCGMGAVAAHHAATGLLAGGASRLVSFGFAGALDDGLQPGDLVLPKSVMVNDPRAILPVDPVWRGDVHQLLSGNIKLSDEPLVSTGEVITSTSIKQALAQHTKASAVDMESAAVALIAAEAGVPFIAVRAVSDPLGFSPPEALLGAIRSDGSPDMARILSLIVRGSVSISTLLRLGKDSRAAANTLCAVIRHAGPQIGFTA